jgi:WS/DGAT/MGAT family acyltransferase
MDDFFLHVERSGLPMHFGSLAIYDPSTCRDGAPDLARIRASLQRGIQRAPMLRKQLRLVPLHLDRPYWVDAPDFDIDDHVRVTSSRPGSWDELCTEVARRFERPLDLSGPLWETTVFRNLEGVEGVPPGGFGLLTKMHHSVLDGVSGAGVLRTFHDATAEGEPAPPPTSTRVERAPSAIGILARTWAHDLRRPLKLAGLARRTLPRLVRLPRVPPRRDPTPSLPVARLRFNLRPSSSRVFGGCCLVLEDVEEIRRAVSGATVNDVILAICGGALRRYLTAKGELPADSVVGLAPISIRSGSEEAVGNRMSIMPVALGSQLEDPVERLEAISRTARSSRKRSSQIGPSAMLDLADVVPSLLGELATRTYRALELSSRHAPFFHCVVTNVAGPREPLFLGGSRMVANFGLGPIFDGVGLIHPVLSYCGTITIAFTSCPRMLPDPTFYTECIRDSFLELRAASGLGFEAREKVEALRPEELRL